MKRLLSIALLAATLSAQDINRHTPTTMNGLDEIDVIPAGTGTLVKSSPAQPWRYDGNGALEAFYRKSEKTWYWYSPQQENAMCDIAESNGRHCVRKTIRVRGINRPYTEITQTKKTVGLLA